MEKNLVNAVDSPETKRYSRQALVAGSILMFIWTGFGWNSLSVYSVHVVEDLQIETAQFALMFTFLSMTTAGISWFGFGNLVEKLGIRKYVLISGLMFSAGFVIMGFAKSVYMLWVGDIVFGLGLAGININMLQTMCMVWFKRNTTRYTGIGQSFGPLGGAIGSAVLGVILPLIGWRLPFFGTAAISVVCTIIVCLLFPTPEEKNCLPAGAKALAALKESGQEDTGVKIDEGLSFRDSLRHPKTWLLMLSYIFAGICDYGLLGNFALIAAFYGYGAQAGLIMSFSWLAQIVSFVVLGPVCDKWGSKVAMIGCSILVIFVAAVFLTGHVALPLIFVCGACLGFADGAVQLPMGASARELLGTKEFEKKMGLIGGGCYFGVMLSAVTVARIFDVTGSYRPAMIFIIGLSIVTSLLFLWVTKRIKTDKGENVA